MASAVNELGQLLRGGDIPQDAHQQQQQQHPGSVAAHAAAQAAAAAAAGVDISKLSQLSDFADKELQQSSKPAAPFSQESLIEPHPTPLNYQQASQPADIPAPLLPESQNMSTLPAGAMPGGAAAAAAAAAAEEQQKQMAAVGSMPLEQMMALMPGMLGMGMGMGSMAMEWGGQHLAVSERVQPGSGLQLSTF
jgi:hypothetical protein